MSRDHVSVFWPEEGQAKLWVAEDFRRELVPDQDATLLLRLLLEIEKPL